MAGDWIKMRKDLFTHPKVVRISSAFKTDVLKTVGGLMSVWCLFDEHSTDGKLAGYDKQTLDDYVRWPGFSAALIGIGWLEQDGETIILPRFEAHNGQSAKRRATDAERKREVRKTSAPEADKKRTREEKRREDIKEANASLRATKKCPATFQITEDMQVWAATECPRVNLRLETAKLRDHEFKTARKDWPGTWRNWMRKAQQDAAARSTQDETAYQRSMREKYEQIAPAVAAKRPQVDPNSFFDELPPSKPLEIANG